VLEGRAEGVRGFEQECASSGYRAGEKRASIPVSVMAPSGRAASAEDGRRHTPAPWNDQAWVEAPAGGTGLVEARRQLCACVCFAEFGGQVVGGEKLVDLPLGQERQYGDASRRHAERESNSFVEDVRSDREAPSSRRGYTV